MSLRTSNRTEKIVAAATKLFARQGYPSWRKLKAFVDALSDLGQRLINAVQANDLQTIRKILDSDPELVNVNGEVHPSMWPSDTLTMRLIHLAIAEGNLMITGRVPKTVATFMLSPARMTYLAPPNRQEESRCPGDSDRTSRSTRTA